jgi:hypothetical protein
MSHAHVADIAVLVEGINRRDLDGASKVLDPRFEFRANAGVGRHGRHEEPARARA